MANIVVLDGAAASKYIKASGAGSSGDPFIIEHLETNSAAIAASLSVMDDWDETNRCAVNIISGQVGVAGGAGAVGATVVRTTLASDDPAVALLTTIDADTSSLVGCVSGTELQVDVLTLPSISGTVTANAGTNLNTSALALESGGNLAGAATSLALIDDAVATTGSAITAKGITTCGTDGTNARALKTDSSGELQVDVLTVPTVTVTATSLDVRPITSLSDSIQAVQSGTWNVGSVTTVSTVTTVTTLGTLTTVANPVGIKGADGSGIASNANPLPVSDAGSSLTVDGTVTANAGTNLNTSLLALESGGNLAGAATSLALIDDTVATAGSATPSKGQAVAGTDGTNARILKTNSTGEVRVSGADTLANNQVSVDTTSGGVTIVSQRTGRKRVTIVNHGTTDVYLGQGTVSTANGLLLLGVKGAAITLETSAAVKGIVGSGSQTVSYLEEYDS